MQNFYWEFSGTLYVRAKSLICMNNIFKFARIENLCCTFHVISNLQWHKIRTISGIYVIYLRTNSHIPALYRQHYANTVRSASNNVKAKVIRIWSLSALTIIYLLRKLQTYLWQKRSFVRELSPLVIDSSVFVWSHCRFIRGQYMNVLVFA